jgi:DNA-binding MarR family transcriptional regulator
MAWPLPAPSPPAVAVALAGRCVDDGTMPSSASLHRLARSMDIPFSLTLSFDDLEVLVLAENGGATPLDVEESLGLERQDTKALFRHLVRRGLLDWQGSPHAQGPLPWPWRFGSTVFHLTPLARSLRNDHDFSETAFAASILLPLLKRK